MVDGAGAGSGAGGNRTEPPGPAPKTPRFDGFEDVAEIGRGGFGIIYRAWQPEFQRSVAIKVLNTFRPDDRTVRAFRREAAAMGALSHSRYVVVPYSSGVLEDGQPFLVMPFLDGGSLQDRINQSPLPWADAIAIVMKVARALEDAHAKDVFHLDVKPENVLFTADGEPQLADFGIARLENLTHLRTESRAFTVLYTAPEMFSDGAGGAVADVYSLAATLYASLCGRPAFFRSETEPSYVTQNRVAAQRLARPAERVVPGELWSVIERAMSKQPEARQHSATEFREALQTAEARLGVAATRLLPHRVDLEGRAQALQVDVPGSDAALEPDPATLVERRDDGPSETADDISVSLRGDPRPTIELGGARSGRGDPRATVGHDDDEVASDVSRMFDPATDRRRPDVAAGDDTAPGTEDAVGDEEVAGDVAAPAVEEPQNRHPGAPHAESRRTHVGGRPREPKPPLEPPPNRHPGAPHAESRRTEVGGKRRKTKPPPEPPPNQHPGAPHAESRRTRVTDEPDHSRRTPGDDGRPTTDRNRQADREARPDDPVTPGPGSTPDHRVPRWRTLRRHESAAESGDRLALGAVEYVGIGVLAVICGVLIAWPLAVYALRQLDQGEDAARASATIRVGSFPVGAAADSDGVWVTNDSAGTVSRIDPSTNEVTEVVPVGVFPRGVAVAGDAAWVVSAFDGTVSRIAVATNEVVATVPVGANPEGVAATGDTVWVTNTGDGTVSRIDAVTNEVVEIVRVGESPGGVAATGDTVWVVNSGDGTVSRIAVALNAVVETFRVGESPEAVAATGDAVWVTNTDDGTVSRLDATP